MFFDLNVFIPVSGQLAGPSHSKKGKGKQQQHQPTTSPVYSSAQITAIEARVDLLVHLGYAVFAFNQTVHKKVDPKTHVNVLDPLLRQLRKRTGVLYLKRLTIILDDDSEKGSGLTNANITLLSHYDLIAVVPTTPSTFSLACLTLSLPSPQTAHIISLPLTLPRLPFLKHTLIRTAIKNGAVFEINYGGALGGEADPVLVDAGGAESGVNAKRNWWAGARELARVTKGKGIVVSSGVVVEGDLRAPRDVGNLITILGLAQNLAHDTSTTTPKSLVLRAQTRQTYRAVLSEPKLVVPSADLGATTNHDPPGKHDAQKSADQAPPPPSSQIDAPVACGSKRTRGDDDNDVDVEAAASASSTGVREESTKTKNKKRKKDNKGRDKAQDGQKPLDGG